MHAFKVDVRFYGTLYITAKDAAHAREIANGFKHSALQMNGNAYDEQGTFTFDDGGADMVLGDAVLSQCFTCHGVDVDTEVESNE